MTFKLITFDVTGTLLKFKHPVGLIYSEVAARYGIKSDPRVLSKNFKKEYESINKRLPNYGVNRYISWETWWRDLIINTFSETEKPSRTKLDKVSDVLINDVFCSKNGWIVSNGAYEILDYLKSQGICLGVITNFDPRVRSLLKIFALDTYFDFVIISYEVKLLKPDIRIFSIAGKNYLLKTGEHLNLKQANHVGDSAETDCKGALCAGWNYSLLSSNKEKTVTLFPYVQYNNIFLDLIELRNHFQLKCNY